MAPDCIGDRAAVQREGRSGANLGRCTAECRVAGSTHIPESLLHPHRTSFEPSAVSYNTSTPPPPCPPRDLLPLLPRSVADCGFLPVRHSKPASTLIQQLRLAGDPGTPAGFHPRPELDFAGPKLAATDASFIIAAAWLRSEIALQLCDSRPRLCLSSPKAPRAPAALPSSTAGGTIP